MPLNPYADFDQDSFPWFTMVIPPYWDQNMLSQNQSYLEPIPRPTIIPIPANEKWVVWPNIPGKWYRFFPPSIKDKLAYVCKSYMQIHIDRITQVIHTVLTRFGQTFSPDSLGLYCDIAADWLRRYHLTVRQAYRFLLDPYLKLYLRAILYYSPGYNLTVFYDRMRYDAEAVISGLIKYRTAWTWVTRLMEGYAKVGAGLHGWIGILVIGCVILYIISLKPQNKRISSLKTPVCACSHHHKALTHPSDAHPSRNPIQDQPRPASIRLPPARQPDLTARLAPLDPQQIVLQYCHPSASHWPYHYIHAFHNASISTPQKGKVMLDKAAVKEDLRAGRVVLKRESRERGWEWDGVQWV